MTKLEQMVFDEYIEIQGRIHETKHNIINARGLGDAIAMNWYEGILHEQTRSLKVMRNIKKVMDQAINSGQLSEVSHV